MRVDRDGRRAEGDVQHDIGGLAADARQRLERLARRRHFAAMRVGQPLRQRHHVAGLGVEKTDGPDRGAQTLLAQFQHFRRRTNPGEQRRRRAVDRGVGGLRRQRDGHQQLVGIAVDELGSRLGVAGGETGIERLDLGGLHPPSLAERHAGRKPGGAERKWR
jgi:hypothetical protein